MVLYNDRVGNQKPTNPCNQIMKWDKNGPQEIFSGETKASFWTKRIMDYRTRQFVLICIRIFMKNARIALLLLVLTRCHCYCDPANNTVAIVGKNEYKNKKSNK